MSDGKVTETQKRFLVLANGASWRNFSEFSLQFGRREIASRARNMLMARGLIHRWNNWEDAPKLTPLGKDLLTLLSRLGIEERKG